MLRKLLASSTILMLVLFLVSGSVFASPTANLTKDQQEALKVIEKANQEIDKKIEKAVKKADELQADYLRDVRIIEQGKDAVKLSEKLDKLKAKLQAENDPAKKDKLVKEIAEAQLKLDKANADVTAEVADINSDINELLATLITADNKDAAKIQKNIDKLNAKVSSKAAELAERTEKYTRELNQLITKLNDETLEISNKAIKKAAELGVIAENSWKLVKIADQWVWIDPLVVGW
ncbi:hypothetical protein [Paenibacillus sp. sgz500958]|uniref:hypothetical protein n=1 Tax=Paenibacillus sp. sgz500958 TaxID=3242475 RepID=UPI0036D3F7D5